MSITSRLKTASSSTHQAAERHPFLSELMSGNLPLGSYIAFLYQLKVTYDSLENSLQTVPLLKDLADKFELWRSEAIASDIAYLENQYGISLAPSDNSNAYSEHLATLATTWPMGLLAHFYTRYLGDLSGGQILKGFVRKAYDLSEQNGTAFYHFHAVENPRAAVMQIKEALDSTAPSEADAQRLESECLKAFDLSRSLFDATLASDC